MPAARSGSTSAATTSPAGSRASSRSMGGPSACWRVRARRSMVSICAIAAALPRGCRDSVKKQRARRLEGDRGNVKENDNLIVGLDIGTSKIVAIVAEVLPEGGLNVIGLGTQPSRGLKKGVVVNIEATMGSIQRVLEEAELIADWQIRDVYPGIPGSHIRGFNSHGMVAIKEKEVTPSDIDRVI